MSQRGHQRAEQRHIGRLKEKTSEAKYTSSPHDEGKLLDPQDVTRCMAQNKEELFPA